MRTPEISAIYAAFDRQTHEIYRAAMVQARDGVVRLVHIVVGCEQVAPELMTLSSIVSPTSVDSARTPSASMLTNDQPVRDVLRLAYELAADQKAANEGWITPHILIAAIVLSGHVNTRELPTEICARLDVRVPAFTRPSTDRRHDARIDVAPSAEVLVEMYSAELSLADYVLDLWLKARETPAGAMREALLARVEQLRRHLYSS